jgi:transcriptional regulator with XRE-family HTH domain
VTSKLRLLCLEHGPQYQIAAAARISPSKLSEYTLGKLPIPMHHLLSLAEVFHCQPEDILGEVEDVFDASYPRSW